VGKSSMCNARLLADIKLVKSQIRSTCMPSAFSEMRPRVAYVSRPQLVVGRASPFPSGLHLSRSTLAIEAG
jgi:hypothetical protein